MLAQAEPLGCFIFTEGGPCTRLLFLAVIVLSTLYLVSYTVYIILRPRKMTFHESLFRWIEESGL